MSLTIVVATITLGLPVSSLHASTVEEARELVAELMRRESLPGLTTAVMLSEEIVWEEGFGHADLEHGVEVNPKTKFRIGSISKSLTSAAVGLLYQEGRLDLDAPVQTYVPSFPDKGHPITTRQLTGHLSGIPHYNADDIINLVHYESVFHALDKFKDRPLLFKPGEKFAYSSFGWNLVAAVVEGCAKETFLDYMKTRVFEPLSMEDTVADEYAEIIPNRTSFYQVDSDGTVINAPGLDNSDVWAGGGFLSTSGDLVRFGTGILTCEILEEETVELMFTPMATTTGETTGYGIGWSIGQDGDRRTVSHGGSHVGATAFLIVYPEEALVVAMITNANSAGLPAHTRRIAQLFLNE